MKFVITYKKDTHRLYISKGIILLLGTSVLIVALIAFAIYRQGDVALSSQTRLGIAPVADGKLPQDSEKASRVMLQAIKKQYEKKLTIIFFYDGYKNQDQALKDIKVLQSVFDTVEPYKSLTDILAFKIITSDNGKCNTEQIRAENVLVCDAYTLIGIQKLGIDHIKLVALSPKEFISTAPIAHGIDTVMSISTYKGNLSQLAYEKKIKADFAIGLGKSLGLFREYNDIKELSESIDSPQNMLLTKFSVHFGRPNCAPDIETAKKWWGNYKNKFKEIGFFRGCSDNPNYYYPQKNTLMSYNPRGFTYGVVAEDYLKGVISCFYGGKEAFQSQSGFIFSYDSCKTFKSLYPNFWNE